MLQRSESLTTLAGALVKVQAEITGAVKDSTNPHFKSKYADLASVWEACRAPLTTHGFAVLQPVSTVDGAVAVTTLLLHTSGEWISDTLLLRPVAETPQGVGSAITYGRRYGLAAMVGVVPEDDDGEAAHGRGNGAVSHAPKFVNTQTGEETANVTEAPTGYRYIDFYAFKDPWHELTFNRFDAAGGAMVLSTKTSIGEMAAKAYREGVPVKVVDFKPRDAGRGYLNKLEVWKPTKQEKGQQPTECDVCGQLWAHCLCEPVF